MIIVKNLRRVAGVGFYKTELAPTSPTRHACRSFPGLMNYCHGGAPYSLLGVGPW